MIIRTEEEIRAKIIELSNRNETITKADFWKMLALNWVLEEVTL